MLIEGNEVEMGVKKKFLPGEKHGRLTIIEESEPHYRKNGYAIRRVKCLCECGGTCVVETDGLRAGRVGGCGKCRKKKYFSGEKYGKLTIIEEADYYVLSSGRKMRQVRCLCECGNERIIPTLKLDEENVSCGKDMCSRFYTLEESSARKIWGSNYGESDLSFEDFYRLSQENCHYCNAPPNNIYNGWKKTGLCKERYNILSIEDGDFVYNGLDRIDSSKPHTLTNVVPCCHPCNWMKNDLSVEEFKLHIARIYSHLFLDTRTGKI